MYIFKKHVILSFNIVIGHRWIIRVRYLRKKVALSNNNDKYHFCIIFFKYAVNVNRRPRVLWIYSQNLFGIYLGQLQNLCIQKIISEKINGLYIKRGEV